MIRFTTAFWENDKDLLRRSVETNLLPLHQKFKAKTTTTTALRRWTLTRWRFDKPEGILSNAPTKGKGIGKTGDDETVESRGKWMAYRKNDAKLVRDLNTEVTRRLHQRCTEKVFEKELSGTAFSLSCKAPPREDL